VENVKKKTVLVVVELCVYVCEFLKNRDELGSARATERNLYVIKSYGLK
jgi:hypothetical protein